jgi:uncharacterized membrane protein
MSESGLLKKDSANPKTEEKVFGRLEAFSDGVFAIALTLLVLDIRIPAADAIHTSGDLWQALVRLAPSLAAFLLSFAVIAISWAAHTQFLKLLDKSTPHFVYANTFFLLTIVIIPFGTAVLSAFGFGPCAAPAVVVYSLIVLMTNLGWILMCRAALRKPALTKNAASKAMVEKMRGQGHAGFILYGLCALFANWFPMTVSTVISLSWIAWLILGLYYEP